MTTIFFASAMFVTFLSQFLQVLHRHGIYFYNATKNKIDWYESEHTQTSPLPHTFNGM